MKKIKYIFRRHFWMQFRTGKLMKPIHFLKILFKRKFFDYPYLAIIETGNTCNLNCPTCPTPRHRLGRSFANMSFEQFRTIIDRIKNHIHITLLYNTNEPLLNPALGKMIKYCSEQNLYSMISTNATLLDETRVKEIFESGLDEILVCLDGASKESYEPFRLGANFENVIKNIRFLCNEKRRLGLVKPFVELQFILTKLNQHEVPLVQKFAKEINVGRLRIKSLALGEYAYSPEELNNLSEKFLPTSKDYEHKIIYEKQKGNLVLKQKKQSCDLAKTQCAVLVDGRVAMCCYDIRGEYVYGNLFEDNFKKIWFSSETKKRRKLAKNKKYPLCKICGEY